MASFYIKWKKSASKMRGDFLLFFARRPEGESTCRELPFLLIFNAFFGIIDKE